MSELNNFLNLENNVPTHGVETTFHFNTSDEVQKYVENLVSNPNSKDPFWDDMAKNLLLSVIFLQLATESEENQNLFVCAEIITESLNTLENDCYLSQKISALPFDHIASMYYKTISIMPPKTLKSVFEHTNEILLKILGDANNNNNNNNNNNDQTSEN